MDRCPLWIDVALPTRGVMLKTWVLVQLRQRPHAEAQYCQGCRIAARLCRDHCLTGNNMLLVVQLFTCEFHICLWQLFPSVFRCCHTLFGLNRQTKEHIKAIKNYESQLCAHYLRLHSSTFMCVTNVVWQDVYCRAHKCNEMESKVHWVTVRI